MLFDKAAYKNVEEAMLLVKMNVRNTNRGYKAQDPQYEFMIGGPADFNFNLGTCLVTVRHKMHTCSGGRRPSVVI